MAKTVILHILGEEPFLADVEEIPETTATFFACTNVRKRDGKPVSYITPGVKTVLFPWNRINFIEVMVTAEERSSVIDFYRE